MVLEVQVVYSPAANDLFSSTVTLSEGSLVKDALEASAVYQRFPEAQRLPLGIYGKQVGLETVLAPADRIEVYRPLLVDPKSARRRRASSSNESLRDD